MTLAASDFIWRGPGSLVGNGPLASPPWLEHVCERCRRLGFTGRLELLNHRGEQMVFRPWSGGEDIVDEVSGWLMAGQLWFVGPAYGVGTCAGFVATQCVPDLDGKFTGGPTLTGRLDGVDATVERLVALCREHRLSCALELRRAAADGVVEVGFTRGVADSLVVHAPTEAPPGSPYRHLPAIEPTNEENILAALAEQSRRRIGGSFEVRLRPLFADAT